MNFKNRWAFLLSFVPIAFGCTGSAAFAQNEASVTVDAQSHELRVSGKIDSALTERVGRVLSTPEGHTIDTLVIQSRVGEVEAAIDLAEVIRKHSLVIRVDGVCATACAGFLLPAARTVRASPDALVVLTPGLSPRSMANFVGGSSQNGAARTALSVLIAKENAFFSDAGFASNPLAQFDSLLDQIAQAEKKHNVSLIGAVAIGRAYLQQCLGIVHTDIPEYSPADSVRLGESLGKPIIFLIGHDVWMGARKIAELNFTCRTKS